MYTFYARVLLQVNNLCAFVWFIHTSAFSCAKRKFVHIVYEHVDT